METGYSGVLILCLRQRMLTEHDALMSRYAAVHTLLQHPDASALLCCPTPEKGKSKFSSLSGFQLLQ
ncbi:hypothetical protein DVQ84_18455 [Yersinia enterocolitica]|nr:hypothetical protein [Yersinia enterocolitica]EKN4928916.1 hypothetical protein [Yersinia enterocolitica]EKN5015356.1 hypothetical protein [Yersinia enterocolitica]EKN5028001.1 hypothetical protein [Yersinia enterocolitica]EKN5056950.1 hypothetical protein [Yersinia enterocolitica]